MNTPKTTPEKVLEAVQAYYHLADAFPATHSELLAWYNNLPPAVQLGTGHLLPEQWTALPDFKRHQLERRGLFLRAYMAANLAPKELDHWMLYGDGGIM